MSMAGDHTVAGREHSGGVSETDEMPGGEHVTDVVRVEDPPRSKNDGRKGWRICVAHRTDGQPCEGPAMIGQKVCGYHGGKSPQAKRAARERLAFAADAAAATLAELVEDPDVLPADRIRAAKEILDRVGIAARHALELTGADGGPVEVTGLAQRLQQVIAAAEPDAGDAGDANDPEVR